MTFNAMTEHYEEITVCGKPALFTSIRIKRDTVPDGLYTYDVRHDDECRGIPCEIAPYVMVNHWGTIILAEPLELPDDGRRYIDEETDWDYSPLEGKGTADHEPCTTIATVYKGNIIKNLIMDCQSYTKYRPNETTGGIFVSWRRKEELPTGA